MWRFFVFGAAVATLAACGGSDTPKSSPPPVCPDPPTIMASATIAGPAADPLTCEAPIATSVLPGNQVQPLGTHTVGDNVPFTIAPGTGGFSIVLQAVSAYNGDVVFLDRGQPFNL